jgi:hypothetical protein
MRRVGGASVFANTTKAPSLNRIGVRAQVRGGEIAVSIQDTGVGLGVAFSIE